MRRLVQFARALSLIGPVLLSACGGATKDSTTFSSGLPPETSLSDLNQADKERLCSNIATYLLDNKDMICKLSGYASASLEAGFGSLTTDDGVQSKCTESRAKCESDAAFAGPSACQPFDISSGCAATVRDYESCLTEELTQLRDYASGLPTCSELKVADFDALATTHTDKVELGTGPACKALASRCPAQFERGAIGGSSSDSGSSTTVDGKGAPPNSDGGTPLSRCGDGVIEPPEGCDGVDLGGQTCLSVTMAAHPTGTLRCQPTCQFDVSGCI